MKWLWPAVALALVGAVAVTAFAQAPAGAPASPGALLPFLQRARQALNLTDDQVARLERALIAHNTRTTPIRFALARARLDLREALLAPTPDAARISEITRRLVAAQGELTAARVQLQLEVRSILTVEQFQRLRLLRPLRRPRR